MQLFDLKAGRTVLSGQSFQDIIDLLSNGRVGFDCKIKPSSSEADDWFDLLKYSDLSQQIIAKLKIAARGISYSSLFHHWYIKDGPQSFGPFSLIQMIEFYQQKRIHPDNLVRHPSYDKWHTFVESGPFKPNSLMQILGAPEFFELISRRRQPRVEYTNEVFVSHNAELLRGVSWSLSAGGIGVVTDKKASIVKGDVISILISSNIEHGSVQIKGRVTHVESSGNCDRIAVQFEDENVFINDYLRQRIPNL